MVLAFGLFLQIVTSGGKRIWPTNMLEFYSKTTKKLTKAWLATKNKSREEFTFNLLELIRRRSKTHKSMEEFKHGYVQPRK